ncbi:hypothetical protein I4U23_012187 [Adineta vaga]|nr:hypothetical protein I4U23_012187 [Adineta vaga]
MDDNMLLEEMVERERMKRDGVDQYIKEVSRELTQNDSWNTFKPDEIAEASLQSAVQQNTSLIDDEQMRRFRKFISIATNFSSLAFAEKLHKIPELVESIKQLLDNMMKEVQEYSDMANELRDLIQCFARMVMQVKHDVNMMLPLLTAATMQMTVVQDVMNTDPSESFNEIDKQDIQLALNRMSTGIQNLLKIAKSSTAESQNLDDRIHNMTNAVQKKKDLVEERLEVAGFCLRCAVPVSVITSGATVGGFVTAECSAVLVH